MRKYFKPEFLNRVDDIIIYNFLTKELIKDIVKIQINQLNKMLNEKKIKLVFSSKAEEFLGEKGYDPSYEARPLKRAIQTYVLDPLANQMLQDSFQEGDIINIDVKKNEQLIFQKV